MEIWLEIYYKEKWNFSPEKSSGTHWNASNCKESHLDSDQTQNIFFEPPIPSNTAPEPLTYPYTPPLSPDSVNAFLHPHRNTNQQNGPCPCYYSPLSLDPCVLHSKMSFKGIDTLGKAFRPEAQEDTGGSPSGFNTQQESKTKAGSLSTPPSDGSLVMGMPGLLGTLIVAVPFPGTPGAPYFDGTDVSDFLDRYEDMCADYQVSDSERRYCETMTAQHIKGLTEYVDKDFEA